MKKIWTLISALLVGVYSAFVAMCMWNWFAVQALNVPNVSFLQMIGLVWLISILVNHNQSDKDETRWRMLFTIIERCVPEEKREIISGAIAEFKYNLWDDVWSRIFWQIGAKTITLILGFVLHLFIV